MAKEASKLEYFYDSSDAEWSDESTSDYWKRVEDEVFAMLDAEENDKKKLAEDELVGDGRWITIGAREKGTNGEDDEGRKGRHLFLDDGETPQEAIEKLKDGEDKPKDKPEEKPADKPAEKSVEKPTEEPDEFAGMSDEDVETKKNDLWAKLRKMQTEEVAYVDSDPEVVRLTKERDELERKGWHANPSEYAEIDKQKERVISDLFDASRNAEERYRKENGYWFDVMQEHNKVEKEFKKRKEAKLKDIESRAEDAGKRATSGQDVSKDLVQLQKEAKQVSDMTDRWKVQATILNKVAKPLVETKAEKMKDVLNKYNSTTDKLLDALAGYDKEFTQAQENEQSFGKRANELWEKYKDKPEGKEKEKAFDELQKARFEYYNAMDKTAEKRKNLVYAFADKMRETYGDTGNKLGRVDKKSSPFCKEMNERLYKLFDGVLGKDVDVSEAPRIRKTTAYRSCHKDNEGLEISKHSIDSNGALIHEYGHYLEEKNKGMLLNSLAFLTYRTKGEELKPMNHYEKGYGNEEKTRADKFFDPYCGKLYREFATAGDEYFNAKSSEIMSMGISRLFDNPTKFAKEDREYFNFVVANMRGEL